MVFLSLDLEKEDMLNYLSEPKLACPAVKWEGVENAKKAFHSIYNAEEDGVPAYLLLDRKGKVISRSIEEPKEKIAELTGAKKK
jgi:hypothetical protein